MIAVTLLQKVQNLISNQPPRIALRIAQPSKEQLDLLGCLPETLIGLTAYLPFISMHRDLLAAQIYGNAMTSKIGSIPTRTVPPLVAMFPNVADSPLLIEALRVSWNDRVSELATETKKDYEELKRVYENHFNTSIYPLACLSDRIPTGFISSQLFQRERPRILALLKSAQSDPVAFFASPEYSFHPYTLQECTFPVKLNA
ncbi:unnamed protein product [Dicrocoelium dendriticum]|nr:unnamed protein product [Dicrocoelium dendriticum]